MGKLPIDLSSVTTVARIAFAVMTTGTSYRAANV